MAAWPGMSLGPDQPARIDPGDGRGVGLVLGIDGDAAALPVGVDGGHAELLRPVERQDLLARLDLDAGDGGHADAEARPLADPAAEALVVPGRPGRCACRPCGPPGRSPCGRSRLCSGAAGRMRRPRASITSAWWSASGSKPKTLSLKPFFPSALPWQPPELQPPRRQERHDLRLERHGHRGESARAPRRGLAPRPCRAGRRGWSCPRPSGVTRPVASTVATFGSRTA